MYRCKVENPSVIWEDILQLGCRKWGCKTLKALLCCLVLGFAPYHIWCTRNELKYVGHPSTEEQILKLIVWEVV